MESNGMKLLLLLRKIKNKNNSNNNNNSHSNNNGLKISDSESVRCINKTCYEILLYIYTHIKPFTYNMYLYSLLLGSSIMNDIHRI